MSEVKKQKSSNEQLHVVYTSKTERDQNVVTEKVSKLQIAETLNVRVSNVQANVVPASKVPAKVSDQAINRPQKCGEVPKKCGEVEMIVPEVIPAPPKPPKKCGIPPESLVPKKKKKSKVSKKSAIVSQTPSNVSQTSSNAPKKCGEKPVIPEPVIEPTCPVKPDIYFPKHYVEEKKYEKANQISAIRTKSFTQLQVEEPEPEPEPIVPAKPPAKCGKKYQLWLQQQNEEEEKRSREKLLMEQGNFYYYKKNKKTFMYLDDTKLKGMKLREKEEERKRRKEERELAKKKKAREEAELAYFCWLEQKKLQDAKRRELLRQLEEKANRVDKMSPEEKKKQVERWLKQKQEQYYNKSIADKERDLCMEMEYVIRKREVCNNAYECWMKRKVLEEKLEKKEWNLRYKFIQKCQRDQKKVKEQLQVFKDIDEMPYMDRR